MSAGATRVVVVDLDGTLCRGDSLWALLRCALVLRPVRVLHTIAALPAVAAHARRDSGRAKERLLGAALAGLGVDAAASVARRAAASLTLSDDVLGRVRAHLAAGDEVWIASASVEPVVAEVARLVGAHGFVGTALEDDGRVLTGRFRGPNCKGAEKLGRLDAVLPAEWRVGAVAYTDSASDQPLMAAVTEARWTRRGRLRDDRPPIGVAG